MAPAGRPAGMFAHPVTGGRTDSESYLRPSGAPGESADAAAAVDLVSLRVGTARVAVLLSF
jgi:hypothetical protein